MAWPGAPIPKSPFPELYQQFLAALPKMAAKDKDFAESLANGYKKYGGWSSAQADWAKKLTLKVSPSVEVAGVGLNAAQADVIKNPFGNVGDMAKIVSLFDTAQKHLKKPAIILKVDSGPPSQLVLKKSSKYEGSVNVVSSTSYPNSYYGFITKEGEFKPKSGMNVSVVENITKALQAFAADPAGVAAKFGKLSGKCCFCNKALTDPKSTSVGYGPVCAGHYGLPWGEGSKSTSGYTWKATNMTVGGAALPGTAYVSLDAAKPGTVDVSVRADIGEKIEPAAPHKKVSYLF